jgi:chromate transporter
MAIFCAYRVAGRPGALIGGLGFVAPAVVMILALSVLFLSSSPPEWVRALGAGAAGAVPAVAVQAGMSLLAPSYRRARTRLLRWLLYVVAGVAAAIAVGPYLVLVLLGCGAIEMLVQRRLAIRSAAINPSLLAVVVGTGGLLSLAWVALKVGALSYGGGFVIVPLMQGDAVHTYHWMTDAQFLNAVALGQVTPGPVVATVAAVGYAAHGIGGGVLAAVVAFVPSFSFILFGGGRFERLRANARARAFLAGAGPAAIGAIFGAAVTLAVALREDWQYVVLLAAVATLLAMRRGVVETLVGAALVGLAISALGGPIP